MDVPRCPKSVDIYSCCVTQRLKFAAPLSAHDKALSKQPVSSWLASNGLGKAE